MPVLPGGVLTIACIGSVVSSSGQTRRVVNVFSYEHIAGGFPPGWPGDFTGAFENTVWSNVAALLHTDYTAGSYDVYDSPKVEPPALFSTGMFVSGGTAGGREPISACVNWWVQTGFRGKSYRSVKRLGPVASSQVVSDELTPAALAAWQAAANTALTTLVTPLGVTWAPRLLSRQLSSVGPPPVYWGAALSAVTVNRTIGLARHRRERTQR